MALSASAIARRRARLGVRLAVDRDGRVGLRVRELEPFRDGAEEPRRIAHDVADHLPPAGHSFALELRGRPLIGTEEERRHAVDLDPVAFLGHRQVEAPQARFDMGDRHLFAGGVRPGERRVGVAVDEHPVGPLGLDRFPDRQGHRGRVGRAQVEPVGGLRDAELVEEDLRHARVPVLPGVQHDLVDPALPQRQGERGGLDELGAVPDHREDLRHGRYDTRRFGAVSSAGRAGDS